MIMLIYNNDNNHCIYLFIKNNQYIIVLYNKIINTQYNASSFYTSKDYFPIFLPHINTIAQALYIFWQYQHIFDNNYQYMHFLLYTFHQA